MPERAGRRVRQARLVVALVELDAREPELSQVREPRGTEPNELFRSEFGQNSCKTQEFSLEN